MTRAAFWHWAEMISDRSGESGFRFPPKAQSATYGVFNHAQFSSPLPDCLGFAKSCYQRVGSHIVALFKFCRPTAVGLFVSKCIVYAINRVLWRWTWAHVRVESGKRFAPAAAYCDATSAIVAIGWVRAIRTALNQGAPRVIFLRIAHSMCDSPSFHQFGIEASTAKGVCIFEVLSNSDGFRTAVTSTLPGDVSTFIARAFYDSKPSVFLAGHIFSHLGHDRPCWVR